MAYGTTPTYAGITTPTRPSDEYYNYTFQTWKLNGTDQGISAVHGDQTYRPTFTQTTRLYTIRFLNEDGSVLETYNLAYNATVSYSGQKPTKAADAQNTYEFAGGNDGTNTYAR